jgi:hypothetical protein
MKNTIIHDSVVDIYDKVRSLVRLIQDRESEERLELAPSIKLKIESLRKNYPQEPIAVLFFLALLSEHNISCFEQLLYEDLGNEASVFIVVNNATEEQCDLIYDLQWTIFGKLSNILINFRLIDRLDMPLEKVMNFSVSLVSIHP